MLRPQIQPQKKPFVQMPPRPFVQPSSIVKGSIPIKEIRPENVEQLFVLILESDVNKIKNEISQKNISLSVRNTNGQSLIHAVLENISGDMKEDEKYELIKFLIDHGAPTNVFDSNNITPLHLAAKYQYPKIVELLINNGADPDAIDSSNMTPLHYATQGSIEVCKKKKKVGSLIPKKEIKDVTSKEMKDLTVNLIEILTDDNFNRYLTHIKNTFKQINDIYPFDFEEEEIKFVKNVADIISDSKRNDMEKKEAVKNRIVELTTSLINLVVGKLQDSTKPLDIGPHNVDGWGPDDKYKVLPKETPETIKNTWDSKFTAEMNILIKKYVSDISSLQTNVQQNLNDGQNLYKIIYKIIYINLFAWFNKNIENPSTGTVNNIPDDQFEMDFNTLKTKILYHSGNKIEFNEINIIGDIPNDDDFLNGFLPDYSTEAPIQVIRGTKKDRDDWMKKKLKLKELKITDDRKFKDAHTKEEYVDVPTIGKAPTLEPIKKNWEHTYDPIEESPKDLPGSGNPSDVRFIMNDSTSFFANKPYYFVSKYIFSIVQIYRHFNILKNNIDVLLNNTRTEYLYNLYHENISYCLLSCYNIFQNILLAHEELPYIKKVISELKDEFYSRFNNNRSHPYAYLIEYCVDACDELRISVDKIFNTMKTIYDNCLVLIEDFNQSINKINKLSGIIYHKKFLESTFTDKDVKEYSHLFDRPLRELKLPPKSFDDYIIKFGTLGNIDLMRKLFYEEYAPYISTNHYSTYIVKSSGFVKPSNLKKIFIPRSIIKFDDFNATDPIIPTIPKSGYLIGIPASISDDGQDNNYDYLGKQTNLIDITFDMKNSGYGLDDNKKFVSTGGNIVEATIKTIDMKTTKVSDIIGKFGIRYASPATPKTNHAIQNIGSIIDTYIHTIKFSLIQNILKVFNKPDITETIATTLTSYLETTKQNIVKNVKENLETSLKNNYMIDNQLYPILFTMVGKIADELITLHIKNALYSGVNRYVKNYLQTSQNIKDYSDIIKGVLNDKTPLFKVDTGFELNLNNLFEDIIQGFYTDTPKNYNTLMYTVNVMEDEDAIQNKDEIDKQHKIYSTNYKLTSEIIEQQCFKIEEKIIDLLGKKMKNVNRKDINGSTALFYAFDTLHKPSIEKLIQNRLNVNIKEVVNMSGMTPYKYALTLYDTHNGSLIGDSSNVKDIIDKFTVPLHLQVKETLEANPDYKNNIIRYMDIIFPQLIVMYNNLLYYYAKSYVGGWTYQNQKDLEDLLVRYELLTTDDVKDYKFPIIKKDITNVETKGSIKLDTLNKDSGRMTKLIKKINDNIDHLKNVKSYLEIERDNPDIIEHIKNNIIIKIAGIDKTIAELTAKKGQIETDNNTNSKSLNNASNNIGIKTTNRIHNLIIDDQFIGTADKLTKEKVPEAYDYIFKKISQSYTELFKNAITPNTQITDIANQTKYYYGYEDYFLYNNIWKTTLADPSKMTSIFNIHPLMSLVQKKLIPKLNSAKTKDDITAINKDLTIVNDLYEKVFNGTIKNMFELPQNYNMEENYVLTEVLDIIQHIVRSVLCSSLYYSIVKVLTKHVLSITPNEMQKILDKPENQKHKVYKNYNEIVTSIVNNIINPNYGTTSQLKPKLQAYIFDEMPNLLVKLKTKIYVDDLDEEKSIKTVDDLFDNINNILMTNQTIYFPKDSSLITSLNNYVFKYYKDVFELLIPKMKFIIDNYSRYIINEGRYVSIIKILNDQAIKEIDL